MAVLKVPARQNDHAWGEENAPVTLVEYGDYECPHCGRANPIVKNLCQHFGSQLRLVYRHFPLTQIHPFAEGAAETAEFAGTHGKFWQMHDLLFESQSRFSVPLFFELAKLLKLSTSALRATLEKGEYTPKVREDFLGGIRSGVNGTPTFFINGHRHNGLFEFDDLAGAIQTALLATKLSA
jgi:protein-disulfide isomerase